ncbi:hypothetical protein RHOER0001_4590 [Rhodococcus erythropolis SK121]|nr:hypothetical protein RHOER0001_4590 [Rhodococcus erythropolis SK121]
MKLQTITGSPSSTRRCCKSSSVHRGCSMERTPGGVAASRNRGDAHEAIVETTEG